MGSESVSAAIFPVLPSQEELDIKDAQTVRRAEGEALGLFDSIKRLLAPRDPTLSGESKRRFELIKGFTYLAGFVSAKDPPRAIEYQYTEDRLEAYQSTLKDLGISSSAPRPLRFPYKG